MERRYGVGVSNEGRADVRRHLVADGTWLSVRDVSPALHDLLHAIRLDTCLHIEPDEAGCLDALGAVSGAG